MSDDRPKTERSVRLDELNLLSQWGSKQLSQELRTALAWYVLQRVQDIAKEQA